MTDPLAADVERALQRAVGEANSAFSVPSSGDAAHSKKKKRKRQQDEAGAEVTEKEKKKKKKEKKKQQADEVAAGPEPVSVVDQPEQTLAVPEASEGAGPKKKKSKKKDKGKHAAVPQEIPPQEVQQLQPDASQSFPPPFDFPPGYAPFPGQHPHYLPFPPPGYPPYPPPTDGHVSSHATSGHHPPPFFPPPPGMDMLLPPELSLGGSAEDILRTLQDLDLSKIANVLKTLNDAAAAANGPVAGPSTFIAPLPPPPPAPARGKRPATSDAILGTPQMKANERAKKVQRKIDSAALVPDTPPNPEHATLLATKWLSTSKLAELAQTEGLVYKKGKFSAIEEEQIKNAIEQYRAKNELSEDTINEILYSKDNKRDQSFWSEIAMAVPQRPIVAVYHHVRRSRHPLGARGKWMPSEDEVLIQAVSELGQHWEKVSARVGRMASDCRDRYRNHLADRDKRATGHWTKDEEQELTRIVTEMTVDQGKDMDNDVFWGVVAAKMGNRRGRQQCRIKWTDSLSKTYKNDGQKPRWSQRDAHILVHKVASLNVRDDTEIDWKILPDENWNLWSAHVLQRRWMTLKKSVRGWEVMTHQEIMDILRLKKADVPRQAEKKGKGKVTSAEMVADEDGAAAESA